MTDTLLNEAAPPPKLGAAPLFIDGLNLAYWCGQPPSLRLPLALLVQMLEAGHPATLYFDASTRYQVPAEAESYVRVLQFPASIIEVPSGRTADAVMLKQARDAGARVISRDRFRDHRRRFRRLIDDPARMLSGMVYDDCLRVPALELIVPLPATVDEALMRLVALLPGDAQDQ